MHNTMAVNKTKNKQNNNNNNSNQHHHQQQQNDLFTYNWKYHPLSYSCEPSIMMFLLLFISSLIKIFCWSNMIDIMIAAHGRTFSSSTKMPLHCCILSHSLASGKEQ